MNIALINSNQIKPPIEPIGLDYIATVLEDAGHQVNCIDLCWVENTPEHLNRELLNNKPDLVGISMRNTDDCAMTSRSSFLKPTRAIIKAVRETVSVPIILGGAGFSVLPHQVMAYCKPDAGVVHDGEITLLAIAETMQDQEDWRAVPNLIIPDGDGFILTETCLHDTQQLPVMRRTYFDMQRYYNEGGQIGFETKRGCDGNCVFCADPPSKGNCIRVRDPEAIAQECLALADEGFTALHTCDSEFNRPRDHAEAVCKALIKHGLGERLQWYAYCSPAGFDADLAGLMAEAGCAGINFGIDQGDAGMLKSLGRDHTPDDIIRTAEACHLHQIPVMFDLLIGAPGENKDTITATINLMKEVEADCVGVAVGVRVYPNTPLHHMQENGQLDPEGLTDEEPAFYIDPAVKDSVFTILDELIQDDPRFFFFNPENPNANYNYNANQVLSDAIKNGARGAFWAILRKRLERRG